AVGLGPGGAVGEETLQRALAQVQVDDGDLATGMKKAGRDVNGQGGLARPALFIADDDDLRLRHVKSHCDQQARLISVRSPPMPRRIGPREPIVNETLS